MTKQAELNHQCSESKDDKMFFSKTTGRILSIAIAMLMLTLPAQADFYEKLRNGDSVEVKKMIERDPILLRMRDELGRFPLHLAVISGDRRMVKTLLEAGAQVNLPDRLRNYRPLHYAALHNHPRIMLLLLAHGAHLNVEDREGFYPLHFAAANGSLTTVEILLRHEADGNCTNHFSQTPLHLVARGTKNTSDFPAAARDDDSYLQVATLLMRSGAFYHLQDYRNDTPLSIAFALAPESEFSARLEKLFAP